MTSSLPEQSSDKESAADILYDFCRQNQIDKVQNLLTTIDDINILNTIKHPTGSTSLHVACYYGHKELVQILLDYGALPSIRNFRHNLTPYEEAYTDEIKQLFINKRIFYSETDYDQIQWSITGDDLIKKRREFREIIHLYRSYDNHHPIVSKLLAEVIHYYLNEYLKNMPSTGNPEDRVPEEQIKVIEDYFRKAIDEKDYLTYFIKAYTLTDYFYRILNKHLALYILQYFDETKNFSSNYRLVNCLVHIVTLLINNPEIFKYQFKGICYRGMRVTENDINQYQSNQHILNRSFLSTSVDCNVAKYFAGEGQQSKMRQTLDQRPLQFSCLCQYKIKQDKTAIDLQELSSRREEKEILILPFAVFKVVNITKNYIDNPQASISVEIELEECEDPEGDPSFASSVNDINVEKHPRRKRLYILIGILISIIGLALTLTVVFTLAIKKNPLQSNDDDYLSPKSCSDILSRSVWNAATAKSRFSLKLPVSYIAVQTLPSSITSMTQQDCVRYIKAVQTYHMENSSYDDISYNFIICGGYDADNSSKQLIYTGRGWKYVGAFCLTYNSRALGIGIIGNYTNIQSLNAFKSLMDCGTENNYVQQNYTIVRHYASPDIYQYYMNYFKNRTATMTQYNCQ
ncbi:unnamed protein product [Didymodactylos carnosus]|uniref:Peptidoglycan recognition protein family domain-containing protein n=1 Tax=Didymodactylos carnosus TaxID=1234261 RepID=A0A814BN51_9BILA|nr:unnamed protein product [Didymodactylos carnosus]CAF3707892.1 unnamed protein product [Didymodactylos carnosus]